MFILIVEKRISCEVKGLGGRKTDEQDWYVLLAIALPFKPSVGFEVQLQEQEYVKMLRVVYNPKSATFWAQTKDVLHPKPSAEAVAKRYVGDSGWDKAVEESGLVDAKEELTKEALIKLQRVIIAAQTRATLMSGPVPLPPLDPRGPRRRH